MPRSPKRRGSPRSSLCCMQQHRPLRWANTSSKYLCVHCPSSQHPRTAVSPGQPLAPCHPSAPAHDWCWLILSAGFHNRLLKGYRCPEFAPTDIANRSSHVDESSKDNVTVFPPTLCCFRCPKGTGTLTTGLQKHQAEWPQLLLTGPSILRGRMSWK